MICTCLPQKTRDGIGFPQVAYLQHRERMPQHCLVIGLLSCMAGGVERTCYADTCALDMASHPPEEQHEQMGWAWDAPSTRLAVVQSPAPRQGHSLVSVAHRS